MTATARAAKLGCNDQGYRVGLSHQNARISAELIQLVRMLNEQHGLGWRRVARIVGLSKWTVKKILSFERRGQVPTQWKPERQ